MCAYNHCTGRQRQMALGNHQWACLAKLMSSRVSERPSQKKKKGGEAVEAWCWPLALHTCVHYLWSHVHACTHMSMHTHTYTQMCTHPHRHASTSKQTLIHRFSVILLPNAPANCEVAVYQQSYDHTRWFTGSSDVCAALSKLRRLKATKCLLSQDWKTKLYHIHTMEYFPSNTKEVPLWYIQMEQLINLLC